MASTTKSVASRGSGWYISRHVLFLGGFVARVIQAWSLNCLARELYARLPQLPHPSRPPGFQSSRANRAHPSHGSLPNNQDPTHFTRYHVRYIDSPSARSPTAHFFLSDTHSPRALDYLRRTHPSSILLLLGTLLPPPQWVSATSPRYASAHLYRCVPWWAQSRLSLDHTSLSRNATHGRLSWQTQSSSRAPLVSRTLAR